VRDVLEIFVEIVLAIAGAVVFGTAAVGLAIVGAGCLVWGSCWSFLGWRRRRAARLRDRG
jgi:hypothetical protein